MEKGLPERSKSIALCPEIKKTSAIRISDFAAWPCLGRTHIALKKPG